MSILVIAEHDKSDLLPATLNTVTAAAAVGGDVDVLVAVRVALPSLMLRPKSRV